MTAPHAPIPGLICVTRSDLTGVVTEWWYAGLEAGERERALRACHARGEVVRAAGRPPMAATWTGPLREHLATSSAVTFRYRPNGREPGLTPRRFYTDEERVSLAVRRGARMVGPVELGRCEHGRLFGFRFWWPVGAEPHEGDIELAEHACTTCVPMQASSRSHAGGAPC